MSYGWSNTYPKARKAHSCEMCGRRIDPGERYLRGAGFDGTAWSWKECLHCEAVRIRYDIYDDDTYSAENFDSWSLEARDLRELRDAAGYRMRWRTRTGMLLPVPNTADTQGENR